MQATVAALRAAYDQLAALPIDALTTAELVGVLDDLETLTCQLPAQSHRLLARLQSRDHGQGDGRQVVEGRAGDPVAHLLQPKRLVGSLRLRSWGRAAR